LESAFGDCCCTCCHPLDIIDLGAGEATVALLLAQRAKRVVAIDNSGKMVEYGRSLAQRNGLNNLDYRLGDMEALPLQGNEVDLALMHQTLHHTLHPPVAVTEAFRVLRPGGHLIILDLLRHDHEAARELYADVWLGIFSGGAAANAAHCQFHKRRCFNRRPRSIASTLSNHPRCCAKAALKRCATQTIISGR
jgi:ubiquinone/menaquinone biosynthesis C-methylase UbiE